MGIKNALDADAIAARNKKIGDSGAATRMRREGQDALTVILKVDGSKLTTRQLEELEGQFRDARHLYNDAVLSGLPMGYVIPRRVWVRLPDGSMQRRKLSYISAQQAQGVVNLVRFALRSQHVLKTHGEATGWLRPKDDVSSIPLPQYGVTYWFRDSTGGRTVHISRITGDLHLTGYGQLNGWDEIGPAMLIRRRRGDYRIAVHVFIDRGRHEQARQEVIGGVRDGLAAHYAVGGIDAGMLDTIIESDGTKSGLIVVPESNKLKHWQRVMSKHVVKGKPHDATWWRAKGCLDDEYERLGKERDRLAREWFHYLLAKYDVMYVQDEQFASWFRRDGFIRGGRTLQCGILGRLWSLLREEAKRHPDRVIIIDKWQPTTSWCEECGRRTKHSPRRRTFVCKYCGHKADRDVHAARNMVILGQCPDNT
ncbi:zinc ribbon domain-containing protein [Bifidobacterium olomucense]|uniref:Transposase n=1 Tax=Bifidobacterium olomucense TaxID=2675324 RepID=A0A7Y0HVU1_9BIFI|nr:zinc ribbon domain-containing protein [Bifidobacterium sp. DSM 109959]NMM97561.1 transposase [Bifidobacterium sp. DSM 109959]